MSCVEFISRYVVFFLRRERERFVTTESPLSVTTIDSLLNLSASDWLSI